MTKTKQVSVALSGSGFRFPAHIGALQAIVDAGFQITDIAGTSGGSIVAALFAKGLSPARMLEIAHATPFQKFIELDLETLLLKNSINSGADMLKWLNTYLGETTSFKDLGLPLTIIATDLNQYSSCVFHQTTTPDASVALACRSSASIPFVFQPVELGDSFLVDGGVSADLPVNYLEPANMKFAIELFESSVPLKGTVSVLTLLSRVLDTFISVGNGYELQESLNVVPVKVTTPPGLSLDTNMTDDQIDQLYTLGHESTSIIISKL